MSIGGINDVELNSVGYRLSKQPRTGRPIYFRQEAPSFVSKNSQGDPTYRDATFWSHWVQTTWNNGTKQEYFNDTARYWKNSATDTTDDTKLTLAKVRQTHSSISGRQLTALGQRLSSLRIQAGFSDGAVSSYLSGSWVFELTSPSGKINRIRPIVTSGGTNMMVITTGQTSGGGRLAPSIGIIEVTGTDPGTYTSRSIVASARASLDVAYYANKFYVGTTDEGRIYTASADTTGTWNIEKVFRTTGYPWVFKEYNGYLYIGTGKPYGGTSSAGIDDNNYNGELWLTDGTNYQLVYPFHWTEVTGLEVYDGFLFIGTWHGEVFVFNGSSVDKLFDIPGAPRVNDMIVYNDQLHIFTNANSEGSHWVFDRRGFHVPSTLSAKTVAVMQANYGYLYEGVYDGSTNSDIYYFDQSVASYAPGGTLKTSYFDANLPSIDKLWKELTIQFDSLPASTSISADYRFREGDSFTSLGSITASAGVTQWTFPFPSATYDKQLSYQFTLSTSVSTSTPTVRKTITKYRTLPDFYYKWDLGIDSSDKIQYLDSSFATSSGRDIQSKILTDKRLKSIVQFKDIDYTSAKINGSLAASATTIPVFTDPTNIFPLQGRLRIPSTNEEVTYTSANVSAFTGVTRNIKGIVPVSSATSATIDNSYRVIFDSLKEPAFSLNLLADRIEDVVPITLLEV